jgi:hypothetical protein
LNDLADILPTRIAFDAVRLDECLAQLPARWCVALLCAEDDRPAQLVAFKNLRGTLRRRFTEPPELAGKASKRIDYARLVKSVRFVRVDGMLEMDLAYFRAARAAFPDRWRTLVPQRTAWFVHIDPEERFPDWQVLEQVESAGVTVGPFLSQTRAGAFIDRARDAFDLCRYPNVLRQSPAGKACAYKEMKKCPAPCDGSIELDAYREQARASGEAARDNASATKSIEAQMKRAAAELAFERASALKSRLQVVQSLVDGGPGAPPIGPVGEFRFVAVEPGPRKGTAKLFSIGPDWIAPVLCLRDVDVIDLSLFDHVPRDRIDPLIVPDHLAMVCHHMQSRRKGTGRLLAPDGLSKATLAKALREVMSIDEPDAEQAALEDATSRESEVVGVVASRES